MPRIIAIEPPETPGTIIVDPTMNPFTITLARPFFSSMTVILPYHEAKKNCRNAAAAGSALLYRINGIAGLLDLLLYGYVINRAIKPYCGYSLPGIRFL